MILACSRRGARSSSRTSRRCSTPCSASRAATRAPTPPVTPVTPIGSPAIVAGLWRWRRRHDLDAVTARCAHEATGGAPEGLVGLEVEAGVGEAGGGGVVVVDE